jgi:predicted 2-oxoglutarate/Fe(II)-dependent dioxygenase YbiX
LESKTVTETGKRQKPMVELLEVDDFLNAEQQEKILSELRAGESAAATVYGKETGGSIESRVRKVSRVNVSRTTSKLVEELLLDRKETFEKHFGVALKECEEPQFLRYQIGDFFVAHQDGNTPMIFDDSRFRQISIVIFLNAQSVTPLPNAYGGGDLTFHGSFPNYSFRIAAEPQPGKLVAFRAETTHEVTPILYGERFTIVSWYR